GNHAQAVALVSKLLGVKATLVMPDDAPAAKLAATRGYGAEIIQYDRYAGDREEIGERLVRERGALLVPPFDDPLVVAGARSPTDCRSPAWGGSLFRSSRKPSRRFCSYPTTR